MYRSSSVGVVVPAYNEAGFVGEVIETVPEFVDRVYVVDDASTDETWDEIARHVEPGAILEAADLARDWDTVSSYRVVGIRHTENRGVGGAIKTGYERARADDLDVVAVLSGDGQMDPDLLERIVEPVATGEADYSKGNRLIYREYRREMSRFRFFGNSLLSFLTKIASGYWRISDPQNGYTAISGAALDRVGLADLYEDYGFANHLLVRLNAQRMRVADVSMPAKYGEESSGIRYRHFVPKLSALLLATFLWRLKSKYVVFEFHPLVLDYALGGFSLAAAVLAAVLGVASLATGGSGGVPLTGAALLTVVGGYALSTGMRLDRDESEGLELRLYDPPAVRVPGGGDQTDQMMRDYE